MQAEMRYCTYCSTRKPVGDFKPVRDRYSGRIINYKCAQCRSRSVEPEHVRDARGEEIRQQKKQRKKLKHFKNYMDQDE
jgi:hypothetical protein